MAARRVSLGYLVSAVLLSLGGRGRDLPAQVRGPRPRARARARSGRRSRRSAGPAVRPGRPRLPDAPGPPGACRRRSSAWSRLAAARLVAGEPAARLGRSCSGRTQPMPAILPSGAAVPLRLEAGAAAGRSRRWGWIDGRAPARADHAADDPSLAKGRSRLRVVAVGFALAFVSIGLRLIDMVGWQPHGRAVAGRRAAGGRSPPAPDRARSRADIVDRNGDRARDQHARARASTPTRRSSPTRPRPRASWRRSCPASTPASCSGGSRAADASPWVKHRITPEEQQAVLELGLPGVGFNAAEQRVYPKEQPDQPCHGLRRHRRAGPGRHRALPRGPPARAAASRWR